MPCKVNLAISVLAVIAVFLLFVSSGEQIVPFLSKSQFAQILYDLSWPNTIVFNLSAGYLSSTMLWFLVVYMPNKSRRRLLRETLATKYINFKREIIQTFIWACGESETIKFVDELATDHIKFREYFDSDSRWYAVLNGIQGSEIHMKELLLAMNIFSKEVEYVLSNLPIDDPSIHRVFKGLNESIDRLKESEFDLYDRVKHVANFLWQILARWNHIEGHVEEDVIEKMIAHI